MNEVINVSITSNYIGTVNKDINIYKYVKRLLDIFFALLLLIIFSIPMIIIALLIKLEDKNTPIFKQERTGLNGINFEIIKFRSMKIDNNVKDFKTDDKCTKIGKIIRKLSLDELPQLFNILKGEMSFIGPRPWIPEYYENMNVKQKERVKVLPGLTGLAQSSGRNGITINEKISKDLEYIDNYSLKEDIKIVNLTIKTVLKKENTDIGKKAIKEEIDFLKNQNNL